MNVGWDPSSNEPTTNGAQSSGSVSSRGTAIARQHLEQAVDPALGVLSPPQVQPLSGISASGSGTRDIPRSKPEQAARISKRRQEQPTRLFLPTSVATFPQPVAQWRPIDPSLFFALSDFGEPQTQDRTQAAAGFDICQTHRAVDLALGVMAYDTGTAVEAIIAPTPVRAPDGSRPEAVQRHADDLDALEEPVTQRLAWHGAKVVPNRLHGGVDCYIFALVQHFLQRYRAEDEAALRPIVAAIRAELTRQFGTMGTGENQQLDSDDPRAAALVQYLQRVFGVDLKVHVAQPAVDARLFVTVIPGASENAQRALILQTSDHYQAVAWGVEHGERENPRTPNPAAAPTRQLSPALLGTLARLNIKNRKFVAVPVMGTYRSLPMERNEEVEPFKADRMMVPPVRYITTKQNAGVATHKLMVPILGFFSPHYPNISMREKVRVYREQIDSVQYKLLERHGIGTISNMKIFSEIRRNRNVSLFHALLPDPQALTKAMTKGEIVEALIEAEMSDVATAFEVDLDIFSSPDLLQSLLHYAIPGKPILAIHPYPDGEVTVKKLNTAFGGTADEVSSGIVNISGTFFPARLQEGSSFHVRARMFANESLIANFGFMPRKADQSYLSDKVAARRFADWLVKTQSVDLADVVRDCRDTTYRGSWFHPMVEAFVKGTRYDQMQIATTLDKLRVPALDAFLIQEYATDRRDISELRDFAMWQACGDPSSRIGLAEFCKYYLESVVTSTHSHFDLYGNVQRGRGRDVQHCIQAFEGFTRRIVDTDVSVATQRRAQADADLLVHAAPGARQLLWDEDKRGTALGTVTAALLPLLDRYGAQALQAVLAEAEQRNELYLNAVCRALEPAGKE